MSLTTLFPQLHEDGLTIAAFAEAMPQIVWTSEPDGNLDYYNRQWFEYTGMTLEDTKNWGWKPVLHPDDLQNCVERWTRAFTSGEPYEVEYRFRRASDGVYRWHLGRARPLRDSAGEIVKWIGTCTDIHEQKTAKEELEASVTRRTEELSRAIAELAEEVSERQHTENAMQQILRNSIDVICTISEDGKFLLVSDGCETVWGYEATELRGRPYMEFVHPEDWEKTKVAAASIVSGISARNFENRYVRKDGSAVSVMWTANWSASDKIMYCVARDISERKRVEAELEAAKEAAEQAREAAEIANRSKSAFLANMSHEIRTPMNGIIGMIELALESPLTPNQRHYLETVSRSADSLVSLINDILDFSKIEAGKLELESIPFRPRELVVDTLSLFSAAAAKKGLQMEQSITAEVPEVLLGDPNRLRQILTNLLGNAVKFTSRGAVKVRVQVRGATMDKAILHFFVTDTGPGIADDLQMMIFDAFAQADQSTTRKFGGTGLGLAICRSLVTRMDGLIAVESTLGQGSTFHFTAALGHADGSKVPEAAATAMPRPESAPRAGCILVAEDNPVNQEVAGAILRKAGFSVTMASDGAEAIRAYEAQRFDVILMDVQMPTMDGFQATAAIRELERISGRHTPIVALTANAMAGDRERCLDGGMDDYCPKPFRKQLVIDTVARWCPVASLLLP